MDIGLAFVGTTSHKNFRVDIEVSAEGRFIEILDRLPKPKSAFRMGVMIGSHTLQSLIRSSGNPFWGRKIHVTLAKIDTIIRKIGSTIHV